MMIAVPLTGFVMTSLHGYETYFFIWELQPLWAPSETGTIIFGAHVLGALDISLSTSTWLRSSEYSASGSLSSALAGEQTGLSEAVC